MMSSATEMMFGGLVMLFCAAILKELPAIPSAAAWGSLFYLTFISSLVGFTLFMYLMLHTTPTLAVSYTFVTPVIGVALGHYG